MILKMMLIVVGIFLLILDLFMYARQKLTDGIGLGWAIVSATFLVSGIAVSTDAATYLWRSKKCGTVCICCVCCYNPVFI